MARNMPVHQSDQHDDPGGSPVEFVNHLRLRLSLSDVRFDLSRQGGGDSGDTAPVWRFTTTPDHLVTMHGGIDLALASYRARFGDIAAVAPDAADVEITAGEARRGDG